MLFRSFTRGATTRCVVHGRRLADADRVEVEGGGVAVTIESKGDDALVLSAKTAADANEGFRQVRVDGPAGLSNLLLVKVDDSAQNPEVEPNEDQAHATLLPRGAAGYGTLAPRDLDTFRFEARAGERLTVELEARRLGAPVTPVVTWFAPNGSPIVQGRDTQGIDGDVRFGVAVPADGAYAVQVRDNIYAGADGAVYRLRVTPAVEGESPAMRDQTPAAPRLVGAGTVVEDSLPRTNAVHRFRLSARAGVPVRVSAKAPTGSWLDPVLMLRKQAGASVAENDDGPSLEFDGTPDPDSRVDLTPTVDETLHVELSDRFGDGGPRYTYRLEVGPPLPDFALRIRAEASTTGALNLRPGDEAAVPFRVSADGRTGPITVRVEGRPAGASSEAVTVRPAPPPRTAAAPNGPIRSTVFGTIVIRASVDAPPGRGEWRVIGTADAGGRTVRREAVAVLTLDAVTLPPPTRPVTVRETRLPVTVLRRR